MELVLSLELSYGMFSSTNDCFLFATGKTEVHQLKNMMSSATDSSHKIDIESEEINKQCCIYMVPKKLRKVKEEAYTPKLISIGPIHRGNSELDMERRKQTYCDKFYRRTKKAKEDFESVIEQNEDKIRKYYAEEITLPCGEEFVKMILLDSIFIIELFLRTATRQKYEKDDYILSKPWLEEGIKHDLRLLENQLPLFILDGLYSRGRDKGFITLAC